jgi:hypothetical protein
MLDMQALIDGMNQREQRQRAGLQMTLGRIIQTLNGMSPSITIKGLGCLRSYRGYYCDLAFEPDNTPKFVIDLLMECNAAMGQVFEGYKGGDYVMGALTPLWISPYGDSSHIKIMALQADGTIITKEEI